MNRRALPFVAALVFAVTSTQPAASQSVSWTRQFGTDKHDVAWSVVFSGSSLFACGTTSGLLQGERQIGRQDGFLRRAETDGSVTWTRQFGTRQDDDCFGVAASADPVYVAGRTLGTFGGQRRRGSADAFVRAYTLDGERRWTSQFGTRHDDAAFGIAVDPSGDVYIAGWTSGRLGDERYRGQGDAFVRRYDPGGSLVWSRVFGTPRLDYAFSLSVDDTGVYVAGATEGRLPGQRNPGLVDLFVRKYSTDGNPLWTDQVGTSREDYAYSVVADASGAYVAGYSKGQFPAQGSGGADAVIIAFDADGGRRWLDEFGTDRNDLGFGVASDGSRVYVVGATDGAFGGFTNRGERDVFARAFDSNGNTQWTIQLGSDRKDLANWAAAAGGVLYAVGVTEGELPGQTTEGDRDAFVLAVG